ncbi:MAG: cation:proton antiporter, partial [Tepidimonas sp.]
THFREAINARLGGVRDFLLLFFFIHLGAELDLSTLGQELWAAPVLAVFVLMGNPLIVMGYMGYRKRTGFLAGLTVAQISEFSIVFVAMGISLGHVDVQALGLTTLVDLITITLSTCMILYSQPLYERLAPWLGCSSGSVRTGNWPWTATRRAATSWRCWSLAWGATAAGGCASCAARGWRRGGHRPRSRGRA